MKEAHLIGNGKSAGLYLRSNPKGPVMTCNLPPFAVQAFATAIVDFKMMRAIQKGEVIVPGDWVLGVRPKMHLEKNPSMYIKHSHQIREFYTTLPSYCPDYTDLTCGHFAAHYMCTKMPMDTLHMYGFDSLFDFDLTSSTDSYLSSDRDAKNTAKLTKNWRNVWPHLFAEFKDINFVLHSPHSGIKIKTTDNVTVRK